jgi:hypothetical protein
MLYMEQDKLLKPHLDKLEELETQVGIREQAERAREGSLFPLGIDGEKVDPEAYFADEADHARRGIRRVYFALENEEVRRQLMKEYRTIEEIKASFAEKHMQEAAREVEKAKTAVRRLPWTTAIVIAVICYAIGRYNNEAIGGALVGFFMGAGFLWNSKGDAEKSLDQAEADFKSAQRDHRIRKLYPGTFSSSEAYSGKEDQNFDTESAYGNVLRFLEQEAA